MIQIRHYGFALTALPKKTANRYREEIQALRQVIVHRRKLVPVPPGPGPPPTGGADDDPRPTSRLRKATCACGFIIRVAKKTIEDTVIRCESCGEPFRLA